MPLHQAFQEEHVVVRIPVVKTVQYDQCWTTAYFSYSTPNSSCLVSGRSNVDDQKSEVRPCRSQSPYRVGSGRRPPRVGPPHSIPAGPCTNISSISSSSSSRAGSTPHASLMTPVASFFAPAGATVGGMVVAGVAMAPADLIVFVTLTPDADDDDEVNLTTTMGGWTILTNLLVNPQIL